MEKMYKTKYGEKNSEHSCPLWTHYPLGTSMCSTSSPFLLPRDLGEMESSNPLITWMAPLATRPHPEGIQEPRVSHYLISIQKDTFHFGDFRIF